MIRRDAGASWRWRRHRDELRRSLDSAVVAGAYLGLAGHCPGLAAFAGPAAVLAWLRDNRNRTAALRDRKDQVLRELIACARDEGGIVGNCAWHLLLCAMEPALAGNSRRTGLSVDEVLYAFVGGVLELNLTAVNRVAATLARNTRRDALTARRQPYGTRLQHGPIPAEAGVGEDGRVERFPDLLTVYDADPFNEPEPEGSNDVNALRAEVAAAVGEENADLVIGAAIYGENQRVLAERMGISYEAARKNYQRSLKRLERRFARARRRPRCPRSRGRLRLRSRKEGTP